MSLVDQLNALEWRRAIQGRTRVTSWNGEVEHSLPRAHPVDSPPMNTNKYTCQGLRDSRNGQYTPSLERLCKCGHTLGSHAAAGPLKSRQCMAYDCGTSDTDCNCPGFKAARK